MKYPSETDEYRPEDDDVDEDFDETVEESERLIYVEEEEMIGEIEGQNSTQIIGVWCAAHTLQLAILDVV